MKIVTAATDLQIETIEKLISSMYQQVFPQYFEQKEIQSLMSQGILSFDKDSFAHFSTLKESFQVMACLETMIHILQLGANNKENEAQFNHNAQLLGNLGFSFPLPYNYFRKN